MEVRGERVVAAPREKVWEALHDPEILQAAIPGCERFDEAGDNRYDLEVLVGVSAIRGRYSGEVAISEMKPPESYRLVARGSGMAGAAEGDAVITLTEQPEGTLVRYDATVRAQGKMARLGGRLIGSAARMMAERFFQAFEEQLHDRAA